MEVLESGEQNLFQWDRKLSELSEPVDSEALLYNTAALFQRLRAAYNIGVKYGGEPGVREFQQK